MTTFAQFEIGDHVSFERSFDLAQFAMFSRLSGDENPYHHDAAYVDRRGGGERLIVPLHMTLAPLSMIAGMIFPGEPSLYLGHDVRAAKPVHYGETLTYSARIDAINTAYRVLKIRVLAIRECEIVLDAEMRVQAVDAEWESQPGLPIRQAADRRALVTGASGEIGQAISMMLARQGWTLLLQDRGKSARREQLAAALEREGASFEFIAADLATAEGRNALADAARGDIALVVHSASARVFDDVADHVAVTFSALKELVDATITPMLLRQDGAFVLIGSSAVEAGLAGWEAYAGAKAMGSQLMNSVDKRYASYGITGHTLALGLVATAFSAELRSDGQPALMPSQAAEALGELLADRANPARDMFYSDGARRRGRFGFFSGEPRAPVPQAAYQQRSEITPASSEATNNGDDGAVVSAVLAALKLPTDFDLGGAGLGTTPGWDSLKHIELVLAVEELAGVRFSANEIEATHTFDGLSSLARRKKEERA